MYSQNNQYSNNETATEATTRDRKASIVMLQLDKLRVTQNETSDAINLLANALEHVLLPQPPSPDASGKAAAPSLAQSPLSEEIERRISVEMSAASRIAALVDRLTV